MEEAVQVLQGVQFADFSECRWCNRSQSICELWERKEKAAGSVVFVKKRGMACEYGRWLLEATAGLLAFRDKDGLSARRQADPTFEQTQAAMGKKDRRGEVEFSGMFVYFYEWN